MRIYRIETYERENFNDCHVCGLSDEQELKLYT